MNCVYLLLSYRLHDRKVCALGLCCLMDTPSSRPASVSQMAGVILPSAIMIFNGLKRAYERKVLVGDVVLCVCVCCTRDEIDWVRWQLPQYVTCLLSSERDAEDKSESDGDSDDDDEEYVEGSL